MMPRSLWRGGVLHVRRSALLYALIVACLATMAVLAYRAQMAARFRHIALDRTLRGHAEAAAWLFSAMASERLNDALKGAFAPLDRFRGAEAQTLAALPAPGLLEAGLDLSDPCPTSGQRAVQRLDLRSGELVSTGPGSTVLVARGGVAGRAIATDMRRAWLVRTLRSRVPTAGVGGHPAWGVIARSPQSGGAPLAYTVLRDAKATPVAVYAFPTCLVTGAGSVYAQVASTLRILPPSLSSSLPNDSIFSIAVIDASGAELYHSAVRYTGPYQGRVTSDGADAVVTSITLRPDVALALVNGSLPPSQLSLLMLLLSVGGVLLASALVLIGREERFARMREEFLARISHELRTPLAQIRMFAELLQLGRPRNEQERQRCLSIIDQESRRLTHLVDNILQFTRGVRELGPLPLVRVELAREIGETVDAFRPLASSRGTRVQVAVPRGIELELCPHAMRQVLLNLLDNAVKFGVPGQTVRVIAERRGANVRVMVDDEGPGIPKRDRRRIWRPFHRLESGETTTVGSGLGLAVVRDLVRRQYGRAWIDDAPGGGARFVIELPRPRDPEPRESGAADAEPDPAVKHVHS